MVQQEELIRNDSLTIGTSVVVVSEECFQQRNAVIIINTSTGGQKISISTGQEATLGEGIQLSPGGVYQDSSSEGYKASNQRITAIADLAGGTISLQERVLMRKGGY